MDIDPKSTAMFNYPDAKPTTPAENGPKIGDMYKQAGPSVQASTDDFTKMLQKNGITLSGLSFNDIGRIHLMGKLQESYGPTFMQHPQGQEILGAFDSQMKNQSLDEQKSNSDLLARTNKTLQALYGG